MKFTYKDNDVILQLVEEIKNNMILVGGNGGSAEQSAHFVAELTGSFNDNVDTVFPAMAMGTNHAEITAFANDFGYKNIFIRYHKVFNEFNPILLLITTSGQSENVIETIKYMDWIGKLDRVFILTKTETNLIDQFPNLNVIGCEYDNTARIQECHMCILHYIAELLKG